MEFNWTWYDVLKLWRLVDQIRRLYWFHSKIWELPHIHIDKTLNLLRELMTWISSAPWLRDASLSAGLFASLKQWLMWYPWSSTIFIISWIISLILQGGFHSLLEQFTRSKESVYHQTFVRPLSAHHLRPYSKAAASAMLLVPSPRLIE